LIFRHPGLAAASEIAELVELRVEPVADDAPFDEIHRRLVADRLFDRSPRFGTQVESLFQLRKQPAGFPFRAATVRLRLPTRVAITHPVMSLPSTHQLRLQLRQKRKRTGKAYHVARAGPACRDPTCQSFEVVSLL